MIKLIKCIINNTTRNFTLKQKYCLLPKFSHVQLLKKVIVTVTEQILSLRKLWAHVNSPNPIFKKNHFTKIVAWDNFYVTELLFNLIFIYPNYHLSQFLYLQITISPHFHFSELSSYKKSFYLNYIRPRNNDMGIGFSQSRYLIWIIMNSDKLDLTLAPLFFSRMCFRSNGFSVKYWFRNIKIMTHDDFKN